MDDNYSVFIDLPGVEKKDIEVSMNDGQVVVLAERKKNIETNSDKYAWQESIAGKYQRTFELPSVINEDNIKAKYNNGVLNLIIPKIKERKLEAKKIAIN
jgi:HSP20 family protein